MPAPRIVQPASRSELAWSKLFWTICAAANELGLDMPQFLQAMWRHVYANRVNEDIESGLRSGVTTTPTLFINGIRYNDAWNIESLLAALARIENS
ncbi:DsbA family protein [Trichocoleus sp. ST-U2]|nr:thioredoxin domain-containing protein [Coleofasciculus sp. FACHB-125]